MDVLVVGLPGGDGIVIHPGRGENGLPQLFHGAAFGLAGEDLLGPGGAGYAGDAPLVLALDGVAVGLDDGIAGLLAFDQLGRVHALESIGVLGAEIQAAGQLFRHVFEFFLFKALHGGQALDRAVAHMELLQRLVVQIHKDLPGAGLVQLVHHHGGELRLLDTGGDEYVLALLHVAAHSGNQLCIAAKSCLLHKKPPKSNNLFFMIPEFNRESKIASGKRGGGPGKLTKVGAFETAILCKTIKYSN